VVTSLFVLVRIFANPVANVFQKQLTQRSGHPVVIIAVVHAALAALCLPYCMIPGALQFGSGVWPNMVVAALLAVAGNVLLVYALSETDLSVLGPINAYKSVVGLVLGIFLIGERPTPVGLAGVLLIVAGSYFVMDRSINQPADNAFVRFFSERGIQLRFAALFFSATEAVFLKRAIILSSPLTVLVLWSVLGFLIALTGVGALVRRDVARQVLILRQAAGTYALLAIATGVMQLATLLTFRHFHVGYSLALFQLSTIVSVVLGRRYFGEGHFRERLVGSLVMTVGAALIVVFGHRS
jgi:drug/metabolite transporter (DMT)-like permease